MLQPARYLQIYFTVSSLAETLLVAKRGDIFPLLPLRPNVHYALFQYPVPFIFYYFIQWPTNAQLFHKLSHCYMFRHHRVILRQLV